MVDEFLLNNHKGKSRLKPERCRKEDRLERNPMFCEEPPIPGQPPPYDGPSPGLVPDDRANALIVFSLQAQVGVASLLVTGTKRFRGQRPLRP